MMSQGDADGLGRGAQTNVESAATSRETHSLRSMRRTAAATTLLCVLVLASLSASVSVAHGRPHAAQRCPAPVSRLLLADGQVEIYEAPNALEPMVLNIYGCVYKAGRTRLVGQAPTDRNEGGPGKGTGVLDLTLDGTFVAYAESYFYATRGSRNMIVVRDLSTGRVVHKVPTGTAVKPEPPTEGLGTVVGLVVKSDGSAAWMIATDAEDGSYQVHVVDKAGSRTLATGGDISPGSLALAGSTLYWTQDGQPRVRDAELRIGSATRAGRRADRPRWLRLNAISG